MKDNFVDRFIEEDNNTDFWSIKKKVGIFCFAIFLGIIMINTTGCTKNSNEAVQPQNQEGQPQEAVTPSATQTNTDANAAQNSGMVTVGNDGVKAGLAGDSAGQSVGINDKMVNVSMADSGRNDPFLPYPEAIPPKPKVTSHLPYLMLPPLENVKEDANATKVLTTKISGIMYDRYSPSAILNIEGTDYLVRSGDVINNYKVLSITKTVVTVQLGSNIYRAGVGQLLTSGGIQYNKIANLQHKFGGARK